ncbi:MAG: Flp pilus assembly complex ATPase component TadA [Armatimonadetes bacterium]|nr:Flp pilus assembly complex ATPase component TadA [Armatimonadota bacterium]
MARTQRLRIGDLLVQAKLITNEQLAEALERQKRTRERLGKVLLSMGIITDRQIAQTLSQQLRLPLANLTAQQQIDSSIARMIAESMARKHRVLPLKREGNTLALAMADPLDVYAIDDVEIATGCTVSPVVTTESDIVEAINRTYGMGGGSAAQVLEQLTQASPAAEIAAVAPEGDVTTEEDVDAAPVIRLVNLLITQALRERASDIHVEPEEAEVRVRFRIDGALQTVMTVPKGAHPPLVSRLKILSRLNIADRRLPQDGSFSLTVEGRPVDFRVATLPTVHGERVTLRLLDKTRSLLSLDQLGLAEPGRSLYEKLIRQTYGIILVCGPTGSGKTTTLVSSLSMINSVDKNIVTIEDPVEYQLPGISHVLINPKVGLTFATGLRSIVRHDPDIIMVGEVRDVETAEIAIHASLTGHLVLSTIHTNDAPSALTRLLDMGIEPFLIASSVIGVLSQRLVRTLCTHCKKPAPIDPALRAMLIESLGEDCPLPDQVMARGECAQCRYTGYRGRTGIYEVLVMSDRIRRHVLGRVSASAISETARAEGMRTMWEDGLGKVLAGQTTVEEVLRVIRADDTSAEFSIKKSASPAADLSPPSPEPPDHPTPPPEASPAT